VRYAAAVAAGLALILPAPALGAQKAIWGPLQLPNGDSAFPLYERLGVDVLQYTLYWSTAAPARPTSPTDPHDPAYRWPAALDLALDEAQAHGIRIALRVSTAPPWANGGRSLEWAPERPQDYADFVAAASRRYPQVALWMIWGEPNKAQFFMPNAEDDPISAVTYAPILDAAYAALKSVSSRNVVIGGMTWSGGEVKAEPFLRWMRLPSGRPPRLDWYGHNPFPFRFPDLSQFALANGWRDISDLDNFQSEVRQTYAPLGRRPKLWLSEFTVQSDHTSTSFDLFVSRREQARWLTAAYEIADHLDSVEGLGWFTLFDEQPESPSAANWGLLEDTGAHKPALDAYLRAPSRRLRPEVRAPRRVPGARLALRGLRVRVRPQRGGMVTVRLATKRGQELRRIRRRMRAGNLASIRLGRVRLRPGSYRLEVDAPRAERVVQTLQVLSGAAGSLSAFEQPTHARAAGGAS